MSTNVNTVNRKPLAVEDVNPKANIPFDSNEKLVEEDQAPTLGQVIPNDGKKEELTPEEKALAQPANPPSKFVKEMQDMMVEINEEKINKIKDKLRQGMVRLEYVTDKGTLKEDLREYTPLTIGKNRKSVRAMKRIKMLRSELENPNYVFEDIKNKYADIVGTEVTKEDLDTKEILEEMIGNFIIEQKAKIYFDIDNIENYTVNDLIILIGLFEMRNNFNPY